jgi:hypothetical protein
VFSTEKVLTLDIESMKTTQKEPKNLSRGKKFHKKLQSEWIHTAEGDVAVERTVIRKNEKKGRVDIYVADEDMVTVVEIKRSDWNRMTLPNLKRNIRRQIRQVWSYIESQIEGLGKDEIKDVCPGVIFPKLPQEEETLNLIEDMFNEKGIQVVWQDESIEERKARSIQEQNLSE